MTQLASTMVSVICSSLLIIAAAFMLAKMIDHYLLNYMDFKRLAVVTKDIYIHGCSGQSDHRIIPRVVVGTMRWMIDEQTAKDMAGNASHQFAVSVERKSASSRSSHYSLFPCFSDWTRSTKPNALVV